MTFIAKLSVEVNIKKVLERRSDSYFDEINQCNFSSSVAALHSTSMPSVRIKLFNKGSVQLTGCKSHVEAMHTLVHVCRYIGEGSRVVSMELVMCNVNISMDIRVNLANFSKAVVATGLSAERPERPPSCIVQAPSTKLGRLVTTLMYTTGKFVICGRTPEDVSTTYGIIMSLFDDNAHIVEPPLAAQFTQRKYRLKLTWMELIRLCMPGLVHTHNPTKTLVDTCPYCVCYGNVFVT